MLLFSSMGLFKLITMVKFYFYGGIWFDIMVLFSSMGLFKLITMGLFSYKFRDDKYYPGEI